MYQKLSIEFTNKTINYALMLKYFSIEKKNLADVSLRDFLCKSSNKSLRLVEGLDT